MELRKNLLRILKKQRQQGFTLIELIVVIGMLGILLISVITTFNPVAQYNKATDGTRQHDLEQIQRSLDAYYNDTGCYPTSLTFGQKWSSGSQVYMDKIPQDPSCAIDSTKCYEYETDTTSTCPQWNVLYAALRSSAVPAHACILSEKTSCVPSNYNARGYNYCTASGNIDCSIVSGYIMPGGGSGGGGATATPTTNPSVTPTPTGALSCPGNNYYGCTSNRCNSIAPLSQCSQNGGTVFCYCDIHCNQSCLYN